MQNVAQKKKENKDIKENLRDVEKAKSRSSDIHRIRIPVTKNGVHREEEIFEMMAEKSLVLKKVMSPHIKKLDKNETNYT